MVGFRMHIWQNESVTIVIIAGTTDVRETKKKKTVVPRDLLPFQVVIYYDPVQNSII